MFYAWIADDEDLEACPRAMNLTLRLPCTNCDARTEVVLAADANWWEWVCGSCGESNQGPRPIDWTLSKTISERATLYRQQGDFATSIVFSAMSLEAELARLYFKWRHIDHMRQLMAEGRSIEYRRIPDDELETDYQRLGNFFGKFDAVCRILAGCAIDDFVTQRPKHVERITRDFPSLTIGSLPKDIHRMVFAKRNRVVHVGYLGHTVDDAQRAQNIADLTVLVLRDMDLERRR